MSKVVRTITSLALASFILSSVQGVLVRAQGPSTLPWMNTALTPEQRADLLIAQMTLEQKVQQISNDVRPAMNPANRPPGCGFQ